MTSLAGVGTGIGAGAEEVDVAETVVAETTGAALFSDRVEYIAAVIPAPVAALAAAIMAKVVLDMLAEGTALRGGVDLGVFKELGSSRKYIFKTARETRTRDFKRACAAPREV